MKTRMALHAACDYYGEEISMAARYWVDRVHNELIDHYVNRNDNASSVN